LLAEIYVFKTETKSLQFYVMSIYFNREVL